MIPHSDGFEHVRSHLRRLGLLCGNSEGSGPGYRPLTFCGGGHRGAQGAKERLVQLPFYVVAGPA